MQSSETPVKVWDAPVRLFHWLLVLLIAFQYLSATMKGDWLTWHMYSGYAILALVLFRILWGFAGSSYARFSSFIAGPAACLRFVKKLLARAPAPYASHNPLGGWKFFSQRSNSLVDGARCASELAFPDLPTQFVA